MTFKPVTHVIFDLDGLLLDSEGGYDKIIDDIAKLYGKRYTLDVRMKILGTPEPETIRLAVQLLDLPISIEEFGVQYKSRVISELANVPMFEGAARLIKHLHKHNILFAVATSGSQEVTDVKLKKHKELFLCFSHIVVGSDPEVKKGKPNPDIFLLAAARFPDKPNPEKCLVFEDAPNGVKGAVAAGMQVVMVPSSETNEHLREGATVVLSSLSDFKPELFGLPPF